MFVYNIVTILPPSKSVCCISLMHGEQRRGSTILDINLIITIYSMQQLLFSFRVIFPFTAAKNAVTTFGAVLLSCMRGAWLHEL
jgi:hypothetical protein